MLNINLNYFTPETLLRRDGNGDGDGDDDSGAASTTTPNAKSTKPVIRPSIFRCNYRIAIIFILATNRFRYPLAVASGAAESAPVEV